MERKKPYSLRHLERAKSSIEGTDTPEGHTLEEYQQELQIPDLNDFEGKRVLDLGAGAARLFAEGLRTKGIHADVISFSPAYANENVRRQAINPNESRAVAGMGQILPFRDGSFDRIVCYNVVEHLPNRKQYLIVLREIIRVLKSGGVTRIYPVDRDESKFATFIEDNEMHEQSDGSIHLEYLENKVHGEWDPEPWYVMVLTKTSA